MDGRPIRKTKECVDFICDNAKEMTKKVWAIALEIATERADKEKRLVIKVIVEDIEQAIKEEKEDEHFAEKCEREKQDVFENSRGCD